MDFQDIIYEIETHPALIVLGIGVGIFALYEVATHAKKPVSVPTGSGTPTGSVAETYNQSFNQYPTITSNPIVPIPSPTPTIPTPIPHPPIIPTSHSPLPLIPYGHLPGGSHVGGAILTWNGITYTLLPGSGGRLWGVPGRYNYAGAKARASEEVLLYGPKSLYG
jgi:hypothetical protein